MLKFITPICEDIWNEKIISFFRKQHLSFYDYTKGKHLTYRYSYFVQVGNLYGEDAQKIALERLIRQIRIFWKAWYKTYLVKLFKDSHGAGLLVVLPAQLNLEGLDVGDAELPDFEGGRQDSALEGAPASYRLVRVQGRVGRLPKHRLNPGLDGRDSGGSANNLHRID